MSSQNKKKKSKVKKILLIVLFVILGIIVLALAAYGIMYFKGKKHFSNSEIKIATPENVKKIEEDGSLIEYNGKKYKYNENTATILCIGLSEGSLSIRSDYSENGLADSLYLLVLDTKENTVNVLPISRDTMAVIDEFSKDGKFIGQDTDFICRSYVYGDGGEKSCTLTCDAVSRLLYNIPIHSYVTIDLYGIPDLVRVTGNLSVPEYSQDLMTKTGNMMELTPDMAMHYVCTRANDVKEANEGRMERQRYFLDAITDKFVEKTKSDLTTPLTTYNILTNNGYLLTDIGASEVTYLATNFITGVKGLEFNKVPGEIISTEEDENGIKHAQFIVDNEQLFDVILKILYKEIS